MNLDPRLNRIDRIGSLVIGGGLIVYTFLGSLDKVWLQGLSFLLGLAFTIGGIGGT